MEFGDINLDDAAGCILAHSVRVEGGVINKGTRLGAEAIKTLGASGIKSVMAARLQPGDIPEDEAAGRIAAAIAGDHVSTSAAFTGRANIFADQAGVFIGDAERIKDLNRIDDAITVATLAPFSRVSKGQMVATVKIIPFAVSARSLDQVTALAASGALDISVTPFRPLNVGLIMSRLPGAPAKVMDKRQRAASERVRSLGGHLNKTRYCDHQIGEIAAAFRETHSEDCDLILVFGGSAIVDKRDVIPAALAVAGGDILHLGMPVDPGNLLLYGSIAGTPVVGIPSCAASMKENGFDWALERIFAGLTLDREAFISMAPGGLLKEIPSRPQPRRG